MRRLAALLCTVALVAGLAGCGSGDSNNTLQTGTNGGTGGQIIPQTPVPTPQVALQDGTGTGMSQRELAFASEVFELLNAYRQANGVPALAWNVGVAVVADEHTARMQSTGIITHDGPPPCAQPQVCPAVRLDNANPPITWLAVRENVARGQRSSAEVMAAWQASPGHDANMLATDITEVGVSFREGASPVNGFSHWWTQHFLKPGP